jgi:hypothetical protein
MMTYADLISYSMAGRGKMPLTLIYDRFHHRACVYGWPLTPHWKGTVRNTLQRHTRGNKKYQKPNLFIHHDRGIWELRNARSRRSR